MKKFIVLMVLLLILFTTLSAESRDSTNIFIKDNSKCLQFSIGSNFQLSSFQGSTISFKKHISESRAYRLGFTTSGNIEDRNEFTNYDTDSLDYRQITDIDNLGIKITGQYLKYIPYEHSYFYYGCGPKIMFSQGYRKIQYEDYSSGSWELQGDISKSYYKSIQFGLVFIAGIEIFISKSISIHSEYSQEMLYQYFWSKQPLNIYNRIKKYDYYSIKSGGVKFGCSFYL